MDLSRWSSSEMWAKEDDIAVVDDVCGLGFKACHFKESTVRGVKYRIHSIWGERSEGRQQTTVFSAPSHSCGLSSTHLELNCCVFVLFLYLSIGDTCVLRARCYYYYQTCQMECFTNLREIFHIIQVNWKTAHQQHLGRALLESLEGDWMTVCLTHSIRVNHSLLLAMKSDGSSKTLPIVTLDCYILISHTLDIRMCCGLSQSQSKGGKSL